jgi:hypothetical protein
MIVKFGRAFDQALALGRRESGEAELEIAAHDVSLAARQRVQHPAL